MINWFNHDKISKDRIENFKSIISDDNSNINTDNNELQGSSSQKVSTLSQKGTASALRSLPLEADVDITDVYELIDEGTNAFIDEIKWNKRLQSLISAYNNLWSHFTSLSIENNELKQEIIGLELIFKNLNKIIDSKKTDENSGKRGVKDYNKLEELIAVNKAFLVKIENIKKILGQYLDMYDSDDITIGNVKMIIKHVNQLNQRMTELMSNLLNADEMMVYCRNNKGTTHSNELLKICESLNLEGNDGVEKITKLTDDNMKKAETICTTPLFNKANPCYEKNTDTEGFIKYTQIKTSGTFNDQLLPGNPSDTGYPKNCIENRDLCATDTNCGKETCYYLNEDENYNFQYGIMEKEQSSRIEDGNKICEKSKDCLSKDELIKQATNNCHGPDNGSERYQCWKTTGEFIGPVANSIETLSKQWSDIVDEVTLMNGKCSIDETCRTEKDANNEETCLASTDVTTGKEDEYTGNYQCYTNDDDTLVPVSGEYRKSFMQGSWDDINKTWVSKDSHCIVNGSADAHCRTQQDVEAQLHCESKTVSDDETFAANWDCYKLNEDGPVNSTNYMLLESVEDTGKTRNRYIPHENNYALNSKNPKNMGVGTCESNVCRPEKDVIAEIDCYKSDANHICWSIYKQDEPTNVYTESGDTILHKYNAPSEHIGQDYSQYCGTNDPCMNSSTAIDEARGICHSVENPYCYRIPDEQKQDHNRRDIVLEENDDGYENGRRTKLHITYDDTNSGKPTKGTCMSRKNCNFNKPKLCTNQQIQCYFKKVGDEQDTLPTPTNMIYNSNEADPACVLPEDCSEKPFCSYKTITNGSPDDPFSEDNTECPPGSSSGYKYDWIMECVGDECIPFDKTKDNPTCVRNPIKDYESNPTKKDEEYPCVCPEPGDDNYSKHYEVRYFTTNKYEDNAGKGYTLEQAADEYCKDDSECDPRIIYGIDTNISGCEGVNHIYGTEKENTTIYCDKGCETQCLKKNASEYCFVKDTNDMSVPRYAYNAYEDNAQKNVESVNKSTPKNSPELSGKGCVDYASPDEDYPNHMRCKEDPYSCKYGEPEWTYTGLNSGYNTVFLGEKWNNLESLQEVSNKKQVCGNNYSRSRTVTNNPKNHSILTTDTITCSGYNESENTESKTAAGCPVDCDFSYNLDQCTLELDANGEGDQYEFVYKDDGSAPYNYTSGPEHGGKECPIIDETTRTSRVHGTNYNNEECCKRIDYDYVYYHGDAQDEFNDTKRIASVSEDLINNWNTNIYQCNEGTKFVNRRLEKNNKNPTCHGQSNYNPSSKECAIPLPFSSSTSTFASA